MDKVTYYTSKTEMMIDSIDDIILRMEDLKKKVVEANKAYKICESNFREIRSYISPWDDHSEEEEQWEELTKIKEKINSIEKKIKEITACI